MNEIPKEIEFNGVTYRLMGSGRYYLSQSNSNEGRRHAKGLHVAIWEFYNGKEVPSDCCIHHIDGNPFNNDISNLECVTRKEHLAGHFKKNYENPEFREKRKAVLERMRENAKEWHKSEEGREWHRQHGKKVMDNRKPVKLKCQYCGKEFESIQPWAKYCSEKCGDAWRYHNRQEKYTGTCIVCGKEFTASKPKKRKEKTRFCSVSCKNKYAYQQRKRDA